VNWPHWVIPLIAIVVWILANLARLPKEAPAARSRRPLAPRPPSREAQAAPSPPAAAGRDEPLVVMPLDKPTPETSRPLSRPSPEMLPSSEPGSSAKAPRPAALAPAGPQPAAGPQAGAEASPAAPSPPTAAETAAPASLPERLPQRTPPPAPVRRVSRTARRVLALLRDPETLAAGVLLQEILLPPLSRRPRCAALRPIARPAAPVQVEPNGRDAKG
jgi:hypothetical protein